LSQDINRTAKYTGVASLGAGDTGASPEEYNIELIFSLPQFGF